MSLSPTQRTLAYVRQAGRIAAIAEKWNAFIGPHGVRQDLFGWIDIIAISPGRAIVGIQSCGQDFAAHLRKMLDSENDATANLIEWLRAGGEVELWGWRKLLVKREGKAKRWVPRVKKITLVDFEQQGDQRGLYAEDIAASEEAEHAD